MDQTHRAQKKSNDPSKEASQLTGNEWELSKENVQPLRHGRNMECLNSALKSAQSNGHRRLLAVQKIEFENALRVYNGTDPLEPWVAYIDWTEQHFPKGGMEGSLQPLVEKCIAEFKEDTKYRNDERYVNVCLKAGNMITDPIEIFGCMYGLKTGITVASFYIKWANALETAGNTRKADRVYITGLKNNAQPKELLERRHKEFLSRIMGRVSEDTSSNGQEGQFEEQRIVMGNLRSFGRKHVVGTSRTGDALTGASPQNIYLNRTNSEQKNSTCQLTVPIDGNDAENVMPIVSYVKPKAGIVSSLGHDSRKENEQKPGKWRNVKVPQRAIAAAPRQFDVHCDAVSPIPPVTPQVICPGASALSDKKGVKGSIVEAFGRSNSLHARIIVNNMVQVYMYRQDLIYMGIDEFQFEEVRAAIYIKRRADAEMKRMVKEQAEKIKQMEQKIHANDEFLKLANLMLRSKGLPANSESVRQILHEMGREATRQDILDVTNLYEMKPLNQIAKETPQKMESANITPASTIKTPSISSHCIVSATPTINTKEAAALAMAIFNKPDSEFRPLPEVKEESTKPKFSQRLNFDVYVDKSYGKDSDDSQVYVDKCRSNFSMHPYINQQSIKEDVISVNWVQPNCQKDSEQRLPFDVYGDSELSDQVAEENQQNIPPKGNVQKELKRTRTAILTPSDNIPFLPLEDFKNGLSEIEAKLEEPKDNQYVVLGNCNKNEAIQAQSDDHSDWHVDSSPIRQPSFTMPINTIFFTNNAKLVSTPVRDASSTDKKADASILERHFSMEECSKGLAISSSIIPPSDASAESTGFVSDAGNLAEEIKARAKSLLPIQAACQRRSLAPGPGEGRFLDLSVITETSRDYKSSSSGSSGISGVSSAAVSHLPSTFSRTKTLGDLSSVSEKPDQISVEMISPSLCQSVSSTAFVKKMISYADPFNVQLIGKFLDELSVPVPNRIGVKLMRGQMPKFSSNNLITFYNTSYIVEHKIGTGAYATIFKVNSAMEISNYDENTSILENMIFKVQTPAWPWEFYISDELHKRLKKLTSPMDITASVMHVPFMYIFNNGSVLVTDFHKCTLLDLVNQFTKKSQTMPELLVIYFTIEILHIVEQFHACQIIHADLKPDNFMLLDVPAIEMPNTSTPFGHRTRLLKLIDYGRCIDMSLFPSGTQFTACVKTECFDCIQMKEGRPWTYQTDLFAIAGCAYVMLFGKYMEPHKTDNGKWHINDKIKRYWQAAVWHDFFTTLLNVGEGDKFPDLAMLRHSFEECLVSSKKRRSEFQAEINKLRAIYGQIEI